MASQYRCLKCGRFLPSSWWDVHNKGCKEKRSFGFWHWLGWTLLILCVGLAITQVAYGEDIIYPEKDWVKGGVYIGRSGSGECVMKPFVKVGTTEDNADDGKAQILGYSPGNVYINRNGQVIFERVYEDLFAERGRPFKGHPNCTCANYNE